MYDVRWEQWGKVLKNLTTREKIFVSGKYIIRGSNGLAVKTLRCGTNGSKHITDMLGDGNGAI